MQRLFTVFVYDEQNNNETQKQTQKQTNKQNKNEQMTKNKPPSKPLKTAKKDTRIIFGSITKTIINESELTITKFLSFESDK